MIGGLTTILSGGILAPGNSSDVLTFGGALTLATGSSTVMEIAGAASDSIDVGGQLTYGGALTLTSDTLIAYGVYDLFWVASETGDFASIILSGTAYSGATFAQIGDIWTTTVGGDTYTFSQLTGDLTVVPEPSTYALLGGMFALAHVMLRRRR